MVEGKSQLSSTALIFQRTLTLYGNCQVLDLAAMPNKASISPDGFRSLQMVLAYNQSDWTYGWNSFMDGFSIFYNPEGETVLDPMRRLVSLNKDGQNPRSPWAIGEGTFWPIRGQYFLRQPITDKDPLRCPNGWKCQIYSNVHHSK